MGCAKSGFPSSACWSHVQPPPDGPGYTGARRAGHQGRGGDIRCGFGTAWNEFVTVILSTFSPSAAGLRNSQRTPAPPQLKNWLSYKVDSPCPLREWPLRSLDSFRRPSVAARLVCRRRGGRCGRSYGRSVIATAVAVSAAADDGCDLGGLLPRVGGQGSQVVSRIRVDPGGSQPGQASSRIDALL